MAQQAPLPYDYFVIEGNIGAGKTTLSRLLAKNYTCDLVLEEFAENPFLPLFYEDPKRYALLVELFFMAERHGQMGPLLAQPSLFAKPVLADYLFLKTWLFARENLQSSELSLFRKLFDSLNQQVPLPGKLIYIHRPVEHLLANIKKRGRDFERKISREYLLKIEQTYFEYFREEKRFPIVVVDAGDADFESNPRILSEFESLVGRKDQSGLTVYRLAGGRE